VKYTVWKCDWCSGEVTGETLPPGYVTRTGMIPVMVRDIVENTKYFVPTQLSIVLCSDKCNQAQKDTQAAADAAGAVAWLREYHARHG